MADNAAIEWVEDVPLIDVGEKVKGGPDGAANKTTKVLITRTDYLYAQLQALVVGGLNVVGTLGSEAELEAIDTTDLTKGTAYFVNSSLRVWNAVEWIDSGSLLGPRGINLLGTWPDAQDLPDISSNEVGDAYIWKGDIHLLIPKGEGETATREWTSIGLKGPAGDSAYKIAQDVDGFQGTKAQWLDSLVGKSAYQTWVDNGNEGKTEAEFLQWVKANDNYQVWLDAGNTGTRDDFLATLKSTTPGPEGPARSPFTVEGTVASAQDLPTPGDATKAYYIGSHLFVWVESQGNYVDLGSAGGLSAYELWVAEGNTGDLDAFFQSLKSTVAGPEGPRGANVNVKGTLSTSASLSNLQDPQEQDAYAMSDTGNLWILIEGTWTDTGPWRGKSNYDIYVDNGGTEDVGTWLASLQGKNGKDGVSLKLTGTVATYSALPAAPKEQDVYAVQDVNCVFAYVEGNWQLMGQFKGEDGENGQNGTSINIIKILTADDNAVPNPVGNSGNAYVDLDGHLNLSNNVEWIDIGPVGAPGPQGPQGTGFNLKGTVLNVGYLPHVEDSENGDAYLTSVDKMMYILVNGQWAGPFDLVGPQGLKGDPGEKGDPGTSINILGAYPTQSDLNTAHPTGNLGDGYLIGTHLWIWTTADGGKWIDVGEVRGPQGIQGPPGAASTKPGPKGDRGTVWITLPAGQDEPSQGFAGNTGDWAVSDTFKVYYRTAANGWVYWGQLVAGDVNSPLESLGKVVRLGNEWVALPIDEVPNIEDGKLYVRALKAGSNPEVTEWVELTFPVDEAPNDGKLYGRSKPADPQQVGTWLEAVEEVKLKDGKIYGRKWDSTNTKFIWSELVIPSGIADLVTKDGKQYARVFETTGSTPIWKEIVTIADVTTSDGKYYARFKPTDGSAAIWKEVPAGITDLATKDGKYYARYFDPSGSVPIWKEVPASIADLTTKDGKQYARVFETAGSAPIWKEIVAPVFDKYTVKLLAATTELDLSLAQVFSIANSSARTLTFKSGTVPAADRSMTVVLIINGAGVITWPASIVWSGSAQPTLGATTTVVTLLWDGIGSRWLGSVGATI